MLPTSPGGIPGHSSTSFSWNLANYAPLTVGLAFLLFGGWWLVSAKSGSRGPVRMGSRNELEQLEAQQEGEFLLPATN